MRRSGCRKVVFVHPCTPRYSDMLPVVVKTTEKVRPRAAVESVWTANARCDGERDLPSTNCFRDRDDVGSIGGGAAGQASASQRPGRRRREDLAELQPVGL